MRELDLEAPRPSDPRGQRRAGEQLAALTNHAGPPAYAVIPTQQAYTWHRLARLMIDPTIERSERKRWLVTAMQRWLTGLALRPWRIALCVQGAPDGTVSLYLGLPADKEAPLTGLGALEGFLPGATFERAEPTVPQPTYGAYLLGIPGLEGKDGRDPHASPAFLDSLVQAMGGENFTVTIAAEPLNGGLVEQFEQAVWSRWSEAATSASGSEQVTLGQSETETLTEGRNQGGSAPENFLGANSQSNSRGEQNGSNSSNSRTIQWKSAGHQQLEQALEQTAQRLRTAAREGAWRVSVLFGASSRSSFERLGTVLTGALAGEIETATAPRWVMERAALGYLDGTMPPLPEHPAHHQELGNDFLQLLTARELAVLFAPPVTEVNGYQFQPTPTFDQQPRGGVTPLGHLVVTGRERPSTTWSLQTDDLVRHTLVVGMTGSGKTNTLFQLLSGLPVPFLVVEPVKTEYRALLGAYPDLRIYTLGDERLSPLRLNPFWFPPGFSLQHHVDSLKAIFSACFAMYASMPNILEQCLYTIYTRKGWSLQHSQNIWGGEHPGPAFYPTLVDLYQEIDRHLSESGYAEEQKQNLRSALLTRLRSLMTGGKGLLLNTTESLSTDELFAHPTVLELDGIPDDDEKALVMGLVLLRLYQHLKLSQHAESEGLRHLLVLEEAHRLFRNLPPSHNPEVANPQGKMVELFANMMAEIRAYGEGIVIVDQVPTKLAPDAIKNTNVKIVHRLVAQDDCAYISTALSITEEEARFCSRLQRGEALAFAEGLTRPAQIKVLAAKTGRIRPSDAAVRAHAEAANPVVRRSQPGHPLADVVWSDPVTQTRVRAVSEAFFRHLLWDQVLAAPTLWQYLTAKLLERVASGGYDIRLPDQAIFLRALMRLATQSYVAEHPLLRNNLRLRSLLLAYLTSATEAAAASASGTLPPEELERTLLQIAAVRADRLFPSLRAFWSATLGQWPLSRLHELLPPDPLDGEAALLAAAWSELQGSAAEGRPATRLAELITRVEERIEAAFLMAPTKTGLRRQLAVKITALLWGKNLEPSLVDELQRHWKVACSQEEETE